MNNEEFKKGIEDLKNIRLTDREKAHMLKNVFSTPIESPYVKRAPMFAFMNYRYTHVVLAACLVLLVSSGGITFASGYSLPGDVLYPIKTRVVEAVLDVVNRSPERKVAWEEQKITRRIVEAEKLADKDELDDERLDELDKNIEKSSHAYVEALSVVASSTNLRREFRRRFNAQEEVRATSTATNTDMTLESKSSKDDVEEDSPRTKHENQKNKIRKLRDTIIRTLDDGDNDNDDDREMPETKVEVETKVELNATTSAITL